VIGETVSYFSTKIYPVNNIENSFLSSLFILSKMSLINSEKPVSVLSKAELQSLVTSDDPLISFKKPLNKRSECWTNYGIRNFTHF